jgi:diacylglycerol kinase family enzyme
VLAGGLRGVDSISLTARLPWLDLEVDSGVDINLDGEPQALSKMHFSVREKALALHLPANSPLLRSVHQLA